MDNLQSKISHNILKGAVTSGILTVVSIGITMTQLRLVLSFLNKDMAGMWFLFLSIGAYIAFFDFGISPTLSREISFVLGNFDINAGDKYQRVADFIATANRIFRILAIIVFFICLFLGRWYLSRISPSEKMDTIQNTWFIFVLGGALNLLGSPGLAAIYGLGNVVTERITRSIMQLMGLGMSAFSLYIGFGIIGLSISWALQGLLTRAVVWFILNRKFPQIMKLKAIPRMDLFRKIALPSFKWALTMFGATLILGTDNIIIASMLKPAQIPPYEAVAKVVTVLMSFSMLTIASSIPYISRSYAANDLKRVESLLLRNVRYGMAVMGASALFLAFFGDKVIELWLGPGNFVGYPILWTFLIMMTLEVHHVIHANCAMAAGHVVFYWPALISGVLNVVFSVILVSSLGLLGVALGTMIAQLLTNNWFAPFITLKIFSLDIKSYVAKVLFPLLLLYFVIAIFDFLFLQYSFGKSLTMNLFIKFIFSGIFSLISIIIIIMTQEEKRFLLNSAMFIRRELQ